MTPSPPSEEDAPIPPAWWLSCPRAPDDGRHAEPSAEQADRDHEPRVFSEPGRSPGPRR